MTVGQDQLRATHGRRVALAPCGALIMLLLIFGALAWSAVTSHSATIDEPLHALGAFLQTFHRNFSMNAEDPPLWKYWAMLPHGRDALQVPPELTRGGDLEQSAYRLSAAMLYQSPPNDGAAFVNRSRAVMLALGATLGALLAVWSWQLGGAAAALVATTLFAFDPNFIAHAPLVKNDVALSLALLALTMTTWSVGQRARWWNVLLLAVLCGVAATVKFSGVLAAPVVLTLLLARALTKEEWIVLSRRLRSRGRRCLAAAGICLFAAIVSVAIIWSNYGLRFAPTEQPHALLDLPRQIEMLKLQNFYTLHHRWPTTAERALEPTPPSARLAQFAQDHHLLPQPWLFGLLFTYRSTLLRQSFILDQRDEFGHWYYFPLAMLFKTPIATLIACGLAVVSLVASVQRRRIGWSVICLITPIIIYLSIASTSNLNLGIQHVLPIYPYIFLLVALAAAKLSFMRPSLFKWSAASLGMLLLVETVAAFPHYISFFNLPSRPQRLHLLSDSNFDWGQDLAYVAEWQQRNPHTPLYLGYLGNVDPAFYGIDYVNIPGGFAMNPQTQWPPGTSGVVAISATLLQGVNCPSKCIELYAPLRARQPREILGDTIYVYDWPPRDAK